MANLNIYKFDNEGYGKFLEELLNLEGEIEVGRGRWFSMNVSLIRQKNIKTS